MKLSDIKKAATKLLKNKYMLLVLLIGLILIAMPTGGKSEKTSVEKTEGIEAPGFSLTDEEARLKETLSQIQGAGKVKVLLSLKSTASRELAEFENEAIVISTGSGSQAAVELRYIYPEYMGAVIVCQGAGSARVRLNVTEAAAAFTGLGSHEIIVIEMNNN